MIPLLGLGVPLAIVVYLVMNPDKAEKIAGWIWSGVSKLYRRVDKKAVGYKVQGEINTARNDILRDAPEDMIEGKLKIRWTTADTAEAMLRDGEVVVFMRRAERHEENVAHALMAYLPKAVVPRARRYLPQPTIRAADLTLAKTVLASAVGSPGALDVFLDEHMDPACAADEDMRERVTEMDEIDLHGWLLRVLLPEFRRLGNELHPGEPDADCVRDAEAFVRWLHSLAAREPGDDTTPLAFNGRFIRVAVVLVANRFKLMEKGTDPYRKQVKRLVYSGDYDAVYVMGRDDNIAAVEEVVNRLRSDGRVQLASTYAYRLRSDFKKRKLSRDRAVVACLRPRQRDSDAPDDAGEELPEFDIETFDPGSEIQVTRTASEDAAPEIEKSRQG